SLQFPFEDIFWRAEKGGKYEDFEKLYRILSQSIEDMNSKLKWEFDMIHREATKGANVALPYFSPEVYCPHLVPVSGRKLCAPWLFKGAIKPNKVDEERWKEDKERVILHEKAEDEELAG
ncbi:hypothetical protein PMAYCL1PPCAC_13267, partial [Pristionchus mayeri]